MTNPRIFLPEGPTIHSSSGAPTATEPVGSLSLRRDGLGPALYVKEAPGAAWQTVLTSGSVPVGLGSIWAPPTYLPNTATWTANLLSLMAVYIPVPCTLTGLQVSNGGTATGNLLAAIWNAAGTSLLASSGSTAQSGTFVTQLVPFSATATVTPGAYLLGLIPSSSSATFVQAQGLTPAASAAQGGFTVPSTVTPPANTARIYAIALATY